MTDATKAALAYEYGVLDAKYDMGYNPPYHGYEKQYSQGFSTRYKAPTEGHSTSYVHPDNWGWY